jgi:hypothetical protein
VIALAALWPAAAHADGAVMVVGSMSPRDREIVLDTVKLESTALSFRFSASGFGRDAADAALECLKNKAGWTCVEPIARGKDQLFVIQVDSDRSAGAPTTIVTARLFNVGTEADPPVTRNCEMCNEDALRRTVSDVSRDLLQRAAARSGRTRLTIHTRPRGARLMLDSKPIPNTEAPLPTYPGKHTLVIQLEGHEPATREIVAVEGATTDTAVDLIAVRGAPVVDRTPHPSRFLPGLAIGIGGAAIISGTVLIVLDQDPDPKGPQQPRFYDTAQFGVATLAAGFVIAATGVYFLMRPHATSTATLAPLPGGGAAIGWAGRF